MEERCFDMFYLMNKDVIAASFDKKDGKWDLLHQNTELPLGKFQLNHWLEHLVKGADSK